MRRIAYSPEVRVYIQPSLTDKDGKLVPPIDISNDIIEGSVERRSNDVSTARFVLQSRRLGMLNESDSTTSLLLSRQIKPMDRIVVYLKKTKPILVFSGYIDLVPLVQFVPEPVVIEASCTLKRLQYTYWDPTLPNVLNSFIEMGMAVQTQGTDGFNVYQSPNQGSGNGNIEDQGFPKLLSFLLIDVGGWDPSTVYIEPLPQEWLDRVEPFFRGLDNNDTTWDNAKILLENALGTSSGGGGGGDDDDDTFVSNPDVDEEKIRSVLKEKNAADWVAEHIKYFIEAGNKYKIDPRFTLAISMLETGWGKDLSAPNNIGGLHGGGRSYPSKKESIFAQASPEFLSGRKYRDSHTIETIGAIYCPPNAPNDTRGTNHLWPDHVGSIYNEFGGSGGRKAVVKGPEYKKRLKDLADNNRNPSGTGTIEKNKITVYLEAFDAGKDLPGYQKRDVFGRKLDDGSSDERIEKNIRLVNKIQKWVEALIAIKRAALGPDDETFRSLNSISLEVVTNAGGVTNPKGLVRDLYLTVDHSDAVRANQICYYVTPKLNTPDLKTPSVNNVVFYGTGWSQQIRKVNQKSIVFNSNQFVTSLKKAKDQELSKNYTGSGLIITEGKESFGTTNPAKNAWKGSIPGFHYMNAYGCIYLQLPNYSPRDTEQFEENWAYQIAWAIINYWQDFKVKKRQGGQKPVDEVAVATDSNSGGDSTTEIIKLKYVTPNFSGESENVNDAVKKLIGYYQAEFPDMVVWSTYRPGDGDSLHAKNPSAAVDLHASNETMDAAAKWAKETGIYDVFGKYGMAIYQSSNSSEYHLSALRGSGTDLGAAIWEEEWDNHLDHHHVGIYNEDVEKALSAFENLTGGSGGGFVDEETDEDSSNAYQDAINFNRAAFNVAYNFPGSMVDSVLLSGQRALQNDVPLFDSVKDIVIGSLRNFCSLPNGDFIAWYPDYFNIAKRNPWLRISRVEIKRCTIDFSDKALATHVYVMGNPWGVGNLPTADSSWFQKLQGAGIVTIEQSGILDSFIKGISPEGETRETGQDDIDTTKRESALSFLEKYGARPYSETNLTIRHPLVEFFYAYNTFMRKWAEQFISRVEFTFMPELFPGMIVEIPNYQKDGKSYTFYVQDVVHNFNYTTGFNTTATLIAPGQNQGDLNIAMVPVNPPTNIGKDASGSDVIVREKNSFKIKKVPSNPDQPPRR